MCSFAKSPTRKRTRKRKTTARRKKERRWLYAIGQFARYQGNAVYGPADAS
jgi:hypothetical protein